MGAGVLVDLEENHCISIRKCNTLINQRWISLYKDKTFSGRDWSDMDQIKIK